MIFETQNSVYELDQDQKNIRRLSGKENPTPRQGSDGQWKAIKSIVPLKVGLQSMIVWGFGEDHIKTTMTSPLIRIRE